MGGIAGGWSIYVKDNKLCYVFNDFSEALHTIVSPDPLPKGKIKAVVDFKADAGGPGKGGVISLSINGNKVGETRTERTPLSAFSLDETFDVGADFGSPVGDYPAGFPYTGKIDKVTVDLE